MVRWTTQATGASGCSSGRAVATRSGGRPYRAGRSSGWHTRVRRSLLGGTRSVREVSCVVTADVELANTRGW